MSPLRVTLAGTRRPAEGFTGPAEERRKRLEEIETLSKDLTWLQTHVPSAAGLVQGVDAATKSALS